jgi:hypothetical protein
VLAHPGRPPDNNNSRRDSPSSSPVAASEVDPAHAQDAVPFGKTISFLPPQIGPAATSQVASRAISAMSHAAALHAHNPNIVVCAAVTRSALAKVPKPPRQDPLRRLKFSDSTVEFPSPMSTFQSAAEISQDYESFLSEMPYQIELNHDKLDDAPRQPSSANSDLLPPPFGAGYILPSTPLMSPFDVEGTRVIFSVDSRCEPFNIIRRDIVVKAGLVPFQARTRLSLGNLENVVESEEMVRVQFRVVMNNRPRLFYIRCVIWDTLAGELLISQKTALATGLTIFCHSPELRDAIVGREALLRSASEDTVGDIPACASVLIDEEEDQHIMETISPVESLRQAMETYTEVDDPWVTEELNGPLKDVFGPLPPEPADVPPLEFDVDEDAVRKCTYGNTMPTKLPATSPHGQDVIDAQWDELKGYNVLRDAYPDVGPGPIASVGFTVAKPGVPRVPRPPGYKRGVTPLDPTQASLHQAYTQRLTADRFVVNFGPANVFMTVIHFAMPSVQENLTKLSKYKFWSKIDIVKAYWGIPVHPRCWKWLYTIAPGGKAGYWIRAPMGAAPVCVWFQYCAQGILKDESDFTLCYADDILVGANDLETLRERDRLVLRRILDAGFRLNPKKCQLQPAEQLQYLGWIIRDGKVFPGENCFTKIAAVNKPVNLPPKCTDKEKRQIVRRFLGLVLYLGHYVPFHAEQLRPLHDLTKTKDTADDPVSVAQRQLKKPAKKVPVPRTFTWTRECDEAWDWAVEQLRAIKPLYAPTYAPGSWLETFSDASKRGWGGILVEFRIGDPRPYLICCVSGAFTGSQLNWSVNIKECYGLYMTVKKMRIYVHLNQFVINVDHRNLLWMTVSVNDMIVRMAVALQQHRYLIRHCPGDSNTIADLLSRDFPDITPPVSEELAMYNAELTDEYAAPSDRCTTTDHSDHSDHFADATLPAVGTAAPIGRDVAPPIQLHQRVGAAPPVRRRQRRVPRQPDAPADDNVIAPDDDLPIFDVGPYGPPPPHRINAEHYHIIKSFHGGHNPHTGVVPLLSALRTHGYNWPTLDEDVRHFVSTCHACQLERLRRRGPSSLSYRTILIPTRLFDVWSFDVLGPLEPCALTGARWIHIGVEETSKITMLGHSVAASTMELVFFFCDCFKIFGLPRLIRSDLGAQFVSRACKEFCASTGIQHDFGIADRHESDGVVENAASLVWPYLRLAVYDLRKYEVWSPLLCNVQLACNALARDVLGGASASELVFGRKVKPMRFMRPQSADLAPEDIPDRQPVSGFIADHASMQLRAIHRADNERHMRYRHHLDAALDKADGVEHLDWIRDGVLVSIPQRDHQTFARPNKFALLRRGPYEVVDSQPGRATAMLIDVYARFRNEHPEPFPYPKVWLHPYTEDSQRPDGPPPPPPSDDDMPDIPMLLDPADIGAILEAVPLAPTVVPESRHVRNFSYRVRWSGRPHTDNSLEQYHMVWHSSAFAEFYAGSGLTGHVPPSAYALRHRTHINQLLHRQAVDRAVPIVDPTAVQAGRVLASYMPDSLSANVQSQQLSQDQAAAISSQQSQHSDA